MHLNIDMFVSKSVCLRVEPFWKYAIQIILIKNGVISSRKRGILHLNFSNLQSALFATTMQCIHGILVCISTVNSTNLRWIGKN